MNRPIAALAAGLALAAACFVRPAHAAEDCGLPSAQALAALSVGESSIRPTKIRGEPGMVVLATLRNASAEPIGDVQVEVRFFDAQHTLMDSTNQWLGTVSVPASGEAAVRLRDVAAGSVESYASHEIRLLSAASMASCAKSRHWALDLLSSWGPMLLLIVLWIWAMSTKRLPMGRLSRLYEQQVAVLGRLADASERRSPPPAASPAAAPDAPPRQL